MYAVYQDFTKGLNTKTLAVGLETKTSTLTLGLENKTTRSTDQDQKFTFNNFRRNSKWQMKIKQS